MICQDVPNCENDATGSTPRFMGRVWTCGGHETAPATPAPAAGDYVAVSLPEVGAVNGLVTAILTSGDGTVSYQLEYAVEERGYLVFGYAVFGLDQLIA